MVPPQWMSYQTVIEEAVKDCFRKTLPESRQLCMQALRGGSPRPYSSFINSRATRKMASTSAPVMLCFPGENVLYQLRVLRVVDQVLGSNHVQHEYDAGVAGRDIACRHDRAWDLARLWHLWYGTLLRANGCELRNERLVGNLHARKRLNGNIRHFGICVLDEGEAIIR